MPKEIWRLVREEMVSGLYRKPGNATFGEFVLGKFFLFSPEPQDVRIKPEAISIEEILCLVYLCELNNKLPVFGFKFWTECFNAFPKLRLHIGLIKHSEFLVAPNHANSIVPLSFTHEFIVIDDYCVPVKDLCKCLILMKNEVPTIERRTLVELFKLFPVLKDLKEEKHD